MTIVETRRNFGTPRLPAGVVIPPNADQKLNANSRLTIVHASRGHGKTTVISSWLSRQDDTDVIWFRVRRDDLRAITAELSAGFARAGLPDPATHAHHLNALIATGGRTITVVVDDAHVLGEDTLEALLTYLLGTTQVRVIVAMRVTSAIVALRQLPWYTGEVTTTDLLFGTDEVRMLGAYRGRNLDHDQAAELVAQTGGWPGIIGAVLSNADLSPELDWEAGSYYFETLFEIGPTPEMNRLNLALGVPELVTDETAQAMLPEGTYPPGYLARNATESPCPLLPRQTLGGYALPEFLRCSATQIFARRFPLEAADVHGRLSDIYCDTGADRAALWHALLASDTTRIRRVIRQSWPSLRIANEDLLLVAIDALDELDPDPWLTGLSEFLDAIPDTDHLHSRAYAALNSRILNAVDVTATVNPEQGRHWLRWAWVHVLHGMLTTAVHSFGQAVQFLPAEELEAAEARLGTAYSLAMIGYLKQATAWLRAEDRPAGAGATAPFLRELRRFVETTCAWDRATVVTGVPEDSVSFSVQMDAYIRELTAHAGRYLHPREVDQLEYAWRTYSAEHLPVFAQRRLSVWEWQTLTAGMPTRVRERLATADAHRHIPRPPTFTAGSVQWVWSQAERTRERLVAGEYADVILETERCAEQMRDIPRLWMSMQLSRAVAAHRLGLVATAAEALHSSVAVATECGLYSPFELIPERELAEIAGTVPNLAETMRDLNLLGQSTGAGQEDLTPRELVVLRLLATGLTVRGIAEELFLSPNTVKTQLAGIYRKLGVATRGEAVIVARQRRLVVRLTAPHR